MNDPGRYRTRHIVYRWRMLPPLVFLVLSVACLAADRLAVRIGVSKSPAALPVLRIIDSGALDDAVAIALDVWLSPEQLLAMAQAGSHQLFTLPLTLAARLHNRGVGVRLTNVNTWGGIYLVTADADLRDWSRLRGRTVHVPQRASPPDALTRGFLARDGLEADDDVRIVYALLPELARLLMAGRIEYAVLLEPQATTACLANPGLRRALSFSAEWARLRGGGGLPNLGFGGQAAFLEANPALAVRFEQAYAEALAWVLANPEAAGRLAERYLGLDAATVAAAVPFMDLRYADATMAAPDVLAFFRFLNDFSPTMLGGGIPDATLFWRQND